jgi:formamidopyrimidine-DNA glycosylase
MPEIAEVARTVHFIRKLLVGKTLAKVTASDDQIVYGKVGTSAAEFEQHMAGKTVVDAGQQGKYFWMIMSSPPHPVMHFGMTGWLKFKSEHTYYYQPQEGKKEEAWPPKFAKFLLETNAREGEEAIEAAFVDMRRLARIRLVDCPAAEIRQNTPLKENGPDPVIDKDIFTVEWLKNKCHSKKVPIKAMLLDQANISGIGNWVGDEVLYNAKIHPEQYANTLKDEQITQLHKSIDYICCTSVELLGDSEKFPEDWLFKHRWQKGKKNASNTLPNGQKIAFLTVGGRTSAVVPSIQKKTGPVAKEMDEAELVDGEEEKPKKAKGKKRKAVKEEDEDEDEDEEAEVQPKLSKKGKKVKTEEDKDEDAEEVMPKKTTARGKKALAKKEPEKTVQPEVKGNATKPQKSAEVNSKTVKEPAAVDTGKRRSGRLSRG